MNKFEQEVKEVLSQSTWIQDATCNISTLHDKEMIEFAEWVRDNPSDELTPELLTIFRNQQK